MLKHDLLILLLLIKDKLLLVQNRWSLSLMLWISSSKSFCYTGYYKLWNIFMIVLLYLFLELLNFLNGIDVIWNISCSTMYDNYIRFLTKFWFNRIAYINICSTRMRSHLYNIFSWYSRTSYIFYHGIPYDENVFLILFHALCFLFCLLCCWNNGQNLKVGSFYEVFHLIYFVWNSFPLLKRNFLSYLI